MTNEASINSSLELNKGYARYRSHPGNFRADVTGSKGPTPGAFRASLAGTRVDLSELTVPGFCRLVNLDPTNYVLWGIYDGAEFYPIGDILPGEFYVIRLSRYLGRSIGTGVSGTGSFDTTTYSLMVKATVAPCDVSVEAFEK